MGLNPCQTVGKCLKLRPMAIGTSNALLEIRDRQADILWIAPKQQPCAKIYLVAAPAHTLAQESFRALDHNWQSIAFLSNMRCSRGLRGLRGLRGHRVPWA